MSDCARKLPRFLQRKIEQAQGIIERGLAAMRQPYVSLSWGKDSTMVLWLLLQVRPEIDVVWMDSGYQFPDTYEFRDRMLKEWDIQNYHEIRFPVDQLEKVRAIGLAEITRDISVGSGKAQKGAGFDEWSKAHGFDGTFWGMRADESINRHKLFRLLGPLYRKANGKWHCAPLAWWTFQELWDIGRLLEIPHNPIYDKTLLHGSPQWIRSSGYLTTLGAARDGRLVWMKHYYPELYRRLAAEFPEVTSYV